MDMNKILKLVWKLLPKTFLRDTAVKAAGKIIDGKVKPEEVYEVFFEFGKSVSKYGNIYFSDNYEKFIESKLQIRLFDSMSAGWHDGLDFEEK